MAQEPNLFDRCGGIRAMADLLNKPPSTVQSWKNAGRIPSTEQPDVLERVAAAGIHITFEDVIWPLGRTEPEPASEAEAA